MSIVFVGNMPWDTTDEQLSAALSAHANILSCDTGSVRNGRKRGWAIVDTGSAEAAQALIAACNGMDFEGRDLNVRLDEKPEKAPREPRSGGKGGGKGKSRGERGEGGEGGKGGGDPSLAGRAENSSGLQVVVRNLPWSVTSEMLKGTFEQIGTVVEAVVVSHADSGRSKGWGTVRFTKPEDATDAIARFGGVELAERPMTVMLDRYN